MVYGDKTLREDKNNSIVLKTDTSKFAVREGRAGETGS